MFMCFLQLFKVGIGFAIFQIVILLLCLEKDSSSILSAHSGDFSNSPHSQVSQGRAVSLLHLSKADAHMLHVCIPSFFSKSTLTAISYIFPPSHSLQGVTSSLNLHTQLPSLSVLVSVPSQCGGFPADSL